MYPSPLLISSVPTFPISSKFLLPSVVGCPLCLFLLLLLVIFPHLYSHWKAGWKWKKTNFTLFFYLLLSSTLWKISSDTNKATKASPNDCANHFYSFYITWKSLFLCVCQHQPLIWPCNFPVLFTVQPEKHVVIDGCVIESIVHCERSDWNPAQTCCCCCLLRCGQLPVSHIKILLKHV